MAAMDDKYKKALRDAEIAIGQAVKDGLISGVTDSSKLVAQRTGTRNQLIEALGIKNIGSVLSTELNRAMKLVAQERARIQNTEIAHLRRQQERVNFYQSTVRSGQRAAMLARDKVQYESMQQFSGFLSNAKQGYGLQARAIGLGVDDVEKGIKAELARRDAQRKEEAKQNAYLSRRHKSALRQRDIEKKEAAKNAAEFQGAQDVYDRYLKKRHGERSAAEARYSSDFQGAQDVYDRYLKKRHEARVAADASSYGGVKSQKGREARYRMFLREQDARQAEKERNEKETQRLERRKYREDHEHIKRSIDHDRKVQKAENKQKTERLHRAIFGKGGAQGLVGVGGDLYSQAMGEMGFKNLSAGMGTFFGNYNQRGFRQAAGLGIGRGVLGFLGSSFRQASEVNTSMLGLSNLVGKDARRAKNYDFKYGFTPQEQAELGSTFASNYGALGGRFNPGGGLTSMKAATRLGVGGQFAGLVGGLAQTGGLPGENLGEPNFKKVLGDVIAVGIDQGLKRGRWRELFAGFANIAKSMPVGLKANFESMTHTSKILGTQGFQGTKNIQAMQMLDTLVKGGGSGPSSAIAMMAAGLGSGKDFFGATMQRQEGMFGGPGGVQRGSKYFDTLKSITGEGKDAKNLRAYMVSQMTGEKLTMKGAMRMEDAFDQYKAGKMSPKTMQAEIDKIQKEEKPLRVKALEGMAEFGGFKKNAMMWMQKQTQIGESISGYVFKISEFLHKRVSGIQESIGLISKYGASNIMDKGGYSGLGGGIAMIMGTMAGDPSMLRKITKGMNPSSLPVRHRMDTRTTPHVNQNYGTGLDQSQEDWMKQFRNGGNVTVNVVGKGVRQTVTQSSGPATGNTSKTQVNKQ